jgi:hypothetical protein
MSTTAGSRAKPVCPMFSRTPADGGVSPDRYVCCSDVFVAVRSGPPVGMRPRDRWRVKISACRFGNPNLSRPECA